MRVSTQLMVWGLLLSQLALAQPNPVRAEELYQAGIKLYNEAVKLATPESYSLALQKAQEAIDADRSLASAWRLHGHILKQSPGAPELKRLMREIALKDYTQAISLEPSSAQGWFGRGNLNFDIGVALNWSKEKPTSPSDGYTKLQLDSRGKTRDEVLDLAIADLTQALSLEKHETIYLVRANAYQYRLDAVHAKADFEAVIKLNPANQVAKGCLQSCDNLISNMKRDRGTR